MLLVAGVDIGNSTTEVAIAQINGSKLEFYTSGIEKTTGVKGTKRNIRGIVNALNNALENTPYQIKDISLILLNEATPVIGDIAMETITETVITESTIIGHNPSTPGGVGFGVGTTISFQELMSHRGKEPVIPLINAGYDFADVAAEINHKLDQGIRIVGVIVQNDDGVLISNRLKTSMPIVDEVKYIDKVPVHMPAAVEVAESGRTIETLSNPFGIATVFNLDPEETKLVVPLSRALIGNRSAVVIKTPQGDVHARRIPAGKLMILGQHHKAEINIEAGADEIMSSVEKVKPVLDVRGEPGTNVGGMLERVRAVMSKLTDQPIETMAIQDILAVDTFAPKEVLGGVAGESALENAVGLAAMVKTSRLPMQQIAAALEKEIGVKVQIEGVEANMAILGALTTPGSAKPLAIVDIGGGSSDAAIINSQDQVFYTHLAGAGDMVTMLIKAELGLDSTLLAEAIKCSPLAKVESLFHMRMEDGSVKFFDQPLDPHLFSRVVVLNGNTMEPIETDHSMERIRTVRREAKRRVFVTNVLRALTRIAPNGNIRLLDFVVIVGGSALDFEIPEMITEALAEYKIVAGRANVRGMMGPRNAVATGLVLSYYQNLKNGSNG
ncbi:diol dehydratase reactivase subunit alpha [Candidatus Formimonas warabiya]|uniref:Diol dehydratase reactivase subunit alpha n=1 Tax=Formimonas warabiya TaxID=1761012 RepID=A0A3G1L0G4_FORW1|nr:diol dehydratase reactivase subunit alpha [Candidatus Formimonas warabiya]ATW27975.1 diol dehydratase reactivase subunit alpha [Candidatus Formimonas warabiya]